MAVYIESRYNDGYIAHHAQDMIRVRIIHRPEDGYLLSYDKEVIKEELSLTDFIERLRNIEGAQKESFENEMKRIEHALIGRQEQQISEWLDHRYARVIREKRAVLMEHTHSINVRRVDPQSVGMMEHMKEENMRAHYPMTVDEAFRVSDDEVYYSMTP